jgi:hypothetical protein
VVRVTLGLLGAFASVTATTWPLALRSSVRVMPVSDTTLRVLPESV